VKTKYLKTLERIDKENKLYCIKSGNGYSCYGFEQLYSMTNKLANELKRNDLVPLSKGTKVTFSKYNKLLEIARNKFEKEHYRCSSGLHPQLIGLEGKRVEVTNNGEKQRFWVGRSTGWIPCHLMILKSNSRGGLSVGQTPFERVKVLHA